MGVSRGARCLVTGEWSGSPDLGSVALRPSVSVSVGPPERAAFVDRDGTLNALVPDPVSGIPESPLAVEQVRLLPGAVEAVRQLASAGYGVVCVTNQPAAAKGKVVLPQLLAVHERVITLLDEAGAEIVESRLCLHHPDGTDRRLSRPCECRKPRPGLLLDAAAALQLDRAESWMLGDTDTDVAAGSAAGCRTALIDYPDSAHKRSGDVRPDLVAASLGEAVAQLLDSPVR